MLRWIRALMLVLALLITCSGGKKVEAQAVLPGASKGLAAAARDQSGRRGTLIIGMSAGNIPYPNTPPNEGFEGRRWVGYQIYDGLANWSCTCKLRIMHKA
jgi:hypothetical protein